MDRTEITRVINATKGRTSFQTKIGSGMAVESFRAEMQASRTSHVGLHESIGMVSGAVLLAISVRHTVCGIL